MPKSDFPALRMRVERSKLVPAGQFDQERLDSYRNGTVVMCRLTTEKDRPLIRKWFAVIGLVIKQCETPWKTKDEASEAIKLALGIVNLSKTVSGQWMQYPKSLIELEDPELDESVDQMIELLSRMTGVDVSTLRKEASSAGADDQATDQPDDADGNPPSVDVSGAGDSALPTESPAPILIRYAREVLNYAVKSDITSAALAAIEKRWAGEIDALDDEGKEKARAIAKSMRSVFNDPAMYDGVIEHYAEMLGCSAEELGMAS